MVSVLVQRQWEEAEKHGLAAMKLQSKVEIKEPSYAAGRTANWYTHYGKQYGASSKN